jgi:hypothetical protein
MNRKLVLICLCAAALCFAGVQAMAQDKPDQQPPQTQQPSQPANPGAQANPAEQHPQDTSGAASISDAEVAAKVDARLQQLTTELKLSDDQKAQIKPVLMDAAKRLQATKNDPQRSVDSKQSKMDEIHDSARGQIRQFLTPDQSKKLDAMKAEDII